MKKIVLFLCILSTVVPSYSLFAQKGKFKKLTAENFYYDADNISYWVEGARLGIIPYNPSIPIKPAEFKSTVITSVKIQQDSPDVPVADADDITQSENSIFVNPSDNQHVLNSNNSTGWTGTLATPNYGTSYLTSYDGGGTWGGGTDGSGGSNYGDPAAAIDNSGKQYIGFITSELAQGAAYSTDGTTWTAVDITEAYSYPDLMDKNHLMVDNTPGGTYEGYVYSAWTHLQYDNPPPDNHRQVDFARSTNEGVSWSTPQTISLGVDAGYMCQGANIQIGPTGQVYVCFTIYDNSASKGPADEEAIGFTRSANGGISFSTATRAIDNINGVRSSGITKDMRVNSFPSMAVDRSGGSYHGNIYIVWANRGTPGVNTGTNVSVYMIRSSNEGVTWTTPVKVNQGSFINDKEAYIPWITCDPTTGFLYCIFYDDRNTASTDVETWVAMSTDGGSTWEDFVVSDVSFTPTGIAGLAGSYFGDYLGITALDNWVYPCWTDNRTGAALTYVSPFQFSGYCMASGGGSEHISGVEMGSIANFTGSDNYVDYTDLSTDIPVNGFDELTVTMGNAFNSSDQCGVWVDWNRDGDFDDASETISVTGTPGIGPFTATIDPPDGTSTGYCVMRVRITYTGNVLPCGETSFGEVEDYSLHITPKAPNVWTGAFNAYWHNSNNWSLGHIPEADEDVIMTSAGYSPPVIDYYNEECRNLTIEAGAGLTFQDNSLTVHDLHNYGDISLMNTLSRLYVNHDIIWYSGSTGSMTASATIDVKEDWDFRLGANVQFTAGYVEFSGTSTSWLRSYEDNCQVKYLRSNKSGGGTLNVSNLSTEDFHITGNIYNYAASTFRSASSHAVILDGFFNNMGGHIYCTQGTFVFNGNPSTVGLKPNTGDYFYNLTINSTNPVNLDNTYSNELTVNGNLTISAGILTANNFTIKLLGNWTNTVGSGGFEEGTSRVIFNGPGHQYILSDETFNIIEADLGAAIRMNDASHVVTCNSYDWTSGGIDILKGTFTALDLVDNGLFGGFWINPEGVMNLHQPTGYPDINGSITFTGGGEINIYGTTNCYFAFANDASITMNEGVLDLHNSDAVIYNGSYDLTSNITGGTIRTAGDITCSRTDFTPAGGTIELYGTGDNTISQVLGSTFYNVNINKIADAKMVPPFNSVPKARPGENPSAGGSKASAVSLVSDTRLTGQLFITEGSLTLNGYELTVDQSCNIYGTLTMNNPVDVLNMGTNGGDQLNCFNGSVIDFSSGVTNIYGWVVPLAGCSFIASTDHTMAFKGFSGGGLSNVEPTTVFGNVLLDKNSGSRTYIANNSVEPIQVNGNFTINPNNEFETQEQPISVAGVTLDNASSEIYLYQTGSKKTMGPYPDVTTSAELPDIGIIQLNPLKGSSSGAKGGSFEMDKSFVLNGILDVGDGDALLHGSFSIASTGSLTIDGGSFICDAPNGAENWQALDGEFNMTGGLFEITNNSPNFGSTATTNISGGIIRSGEAFYVSSVASVFNPTGGTVEMIGNLNNTNLFCYSTNSFYNLRINLPDGYNVHYQAKTNVTNDLTIDGGTFVCASGSSPELVIGGNFHNNVGTDGFNPNNGTVTFNGVNSITLVSSGQEFYNLTLDKPAATSMLYLFNSLDILNEFVVNSGTFYTNASPTVSNSISVAGDLNINNGGVLRVAPKSSIAMNNGSNLEVNDGGSLLVIGNSSDFATLTHASTGKYSCKINSGATIGASNAIFEYMDGDGIVVKQNGIVDGLYGFNDCIFRFGAASPSCLLNLNSDNSFTSTGAYFENSAGTTDFNVLKSMDSGEVTFVDATGDFAGDEFENDPYERVFWTFSERLVNLTVMLEGPYDPITYNMHTTINGLLPLDQPFNPPLPYYENPAPDWLYPGSESIGSIPVTTIVDWVLVQLKDASSADAAVPATTFKSIPAFVLNTGQVTALDGISPLSFSGPPANELFVAIHHRNHLGILSALPLTLIDGEYSYDFTFDPAMTHGDASAMTQLSFSPPIWGMMAGDGDGDGEVGLSDQVNTWYFYAGDSGYMGGDFNLDGQVENKDKNGYWLSNLGNSSFIPE